MDAVEPTTTPSTEEKLNKALGVHRERCREHKSTKKEELRKALQSLADNLRQQALLIDQQREKLNEPPPYSLLKDLHESGALFYLGEEIDWEEPGLAFAPPGGEPWDDYNPATDLIVDCHELKFRIDFTFKACGYKLQDREKFRAPEPYKHLDAAVKAANFPFDVSEMSSAISETISEKEWISGLKERAACGNLKDADYEYDHHYPGKAPGRGYLDATILVLHLRGQS